MRAFTITGPGAGEVTRVPDPTPRPGEVVIQPSHVGICGTDVHIFAGHLHTTYPRINGHEFVGTVAATGSAVTGWEAGDRVAVDPSLYCGACYRCRRSQTNHCERWAAIGDTVDGALAEYVAVPARNLYRLEDHEALEDAVFTEPLACVVWGIERMRPRPGDRALVFGAGPIGSLMAQMLSRAAVADVVVVDVSEQKLRVARLLGARTTYQAGPLLADELRERSQGHGFDLVVDCTGQPDVIADLPRHAGPGARIVLFGVATPDARVDIRPFDVYRNDWEIIGSMAINSTFQQARSLLSSGTLTVRPLVTSFATLDDVAAILLGPKPDRELKVLIRPA